MDQKTVVIAGGHLNDDELVLIRAYRSCDEQSQVAVRTFAGKMADLASPEVFLPANVVDLSKYR